MEVISVKRLSKYYKSKILRGSTSRVPFPKSLVSSNKTVVKAVENITFSVEEGEMVGFIGPNGAGKTTTLKCLSGLIYPTSGTVSVLGYTPFERKHDFLRQISLVAGQKNQLWPDVPAQDSLELSREIYGLTPMQYSTAMKELSELLDLGELLPVPVRKLSLGQRMRCELAASLLHTPRILFLDEPTIGLDVTMQKRLREFLKTFNKTHSTTVILTSHNMDDVNQLCKRIIIIDTGSIVYDGDLDAIVRQYVKSKYVTLRFSKNVEKTDVAEYGMVVDFHEDSATLSVERTRVPAITAEILKKLPVADVDIKEMDLDDVIRMIFEKSGSSSS